MTTKRIIFDLILLVAVFYTPWWFVAIIAAAGIFNFSFYGEAVVAGVLIDLLYGTSSSYGFGAIGLLLAVIAFIVLLRAKESIRR